MSEAPATKPQPTLDELAMRLGYPAKTVTEWAKSNPHSAYTILWNGAVELQERVQALTKALEENRRLMSLMGWAIQQRADLRTAYEQTVKVLAEAERVLQEKP